MNRRSAAFGMSRRGRGFRGGGDGAALLDPSAEAGYLLDFFAEEGLTLVGTRVDQWQDASGTLLVSKVSDATAPEYQATGLGGRPAVLFDITNDDVLDANPYANAATSWTVYCFMDLKSVVSASQRLIDSQTGRLIITPSTFSGTQAGWYDGSYKTVGATLSTGAQVVTWVLDAGGSQGEMYVGSSSIGTAAYTGTAMGARFGIGNHYSTVGGACIDAAIGRVLIYTAAHDAATRQRVWDWGASHYGIAL